MYLDKRVQPSPRESIFLLKFTHIYHITLKFQNSFKHLKFYPTHALTNKIKSPSHVLFFSNQSLFQYVWKKLVESKILNF